MYPEAAPSKLIKIFLASPSDVQSERDALSGLVREINDVLAFLVPDRELRLELLRYETHTYPDVGQAQDVINQQIPLDYDIFIGVMWKRCGTPTASSQSGTIEEFQRALARREQTGRPTIMFYFCEESVPFPRSDELEQLAKVVRFREELASKGYTLSYPSRASFRDHVRGGLLRAVADLLRGRDQPIRGLEAAPGPMFPAEEDKREVASLAAKFDEIRRTMPSGRERTQRMSEITAALRLKAAAVRASLPEYKTGNSMGQHLAAVCILQQFPNAAELTWLAERLDPDKEPPYTGYQAAVALAQAVRSLPHTDNSTLENGVNTALSLAKRNPNDPGRIRVLEQAISELQAKVASSWLTKTLPFQKEAPNRADRFDQRTDPWSRI